MTTLPQEKREALAREALARDAAAGAALLRGAVVRAGAILGGIVSLALLALMFATAAARADTWYLLQSGPQSLDVDAPHRLGALLTLALLGVGLAILGVGIVRPRPDVAAPTRPVRPAAPRR